jgi:GT2 family glycosyltransferase
MGGCIERLVEALAAQTLHRSRFEVIIADDGSADGPPRRLADPPWLCVDAGPPRNSFAARNRGAALARGCVLAFTDADCLPEPTWLERGLAALGDAGLIAGRVEPLLPARPSVWTLLDMGVWHDLERIVLTGGAVTANLFVRREDFDRVGGFDETNPSEGDFDFAQRCLAAGLTGALVQEAVVWHPTIDRPGPLLRKQWFRHRWAAVREARAGRLPERLRPVYWIPGMSLRRRRRAGLPLAFDPHRLSDPRLRERVSPARLLAAWLIRDLALHYWASAAQLVGWASIRIGVRPKPTARLPCSENDR